MFYTLLHIAEGVIIPNCGWKSKSQWKKYFKDGNVIVWSPEHELYWTAGKRRKNPLGSHSHPEYIILDRKQLEIIEAYNSGGLTVEEHKENCELAKKELMYLKRGLK